ncbi:Cys-tRNA(Pro)/Cys-tRNA(Cys) deacylase [Saccharopolyspora lacisalsi]|uniref:Cys-tRNA(Pro)/Cys-tRNA(Cys) deacylase n=1 Tax=Halosaccharopolyspora lacisalsi TaxID=1000566 RepID=A0A839DXW4_9PSEU|nr:Cys-tRNA(Pro) deacylase [Halosaccharopolyspora lacisalsi]MBA8825066.1 Cys-tRNA(Pro)/Cys-tRNA(Cys) deacylase [Halosaccharopolyspora lacisalsi]
MAGRGTPATALLARRRVAHHVHAYEHDPRSTSYGQEAAEALGASPERVFKTLVAEVDGTLTIAVVPVPGSLDLKALAAARAGKKAGLAPEPDAERVTGYVSGGISPLGQKRRSPTVLDISATRFDTIYCSAGRRGLEIELAPDELVRLTGATVATITARRD